MTNCVTDLLRFGQPTAADWEILNIAGSAGNPEDLEPEDVVAYEQKTGQWIGDPVDTAARLNRYIAHAKLRVSRPTFWRDIRKICPGFGENVESIDPVCMAKVELKRARKPAGSTFEVKDVIDSVVTAAELDPDRIEDLRFEFAPMLMAMANSRHNYEPARLAAIQALGRIGAMEQLRNIADTGDGWSDKNINTWFPVEHDIRRMAAALELTKLGEKGYSDKIAKYFERVAIKQEDRKRCIEKMWDFEDLFYEAIDVLALGKKHAQFLYKIVTQCGEAHMKDAAVNALGRSGANTGGGTSIIF